MEKEFKILTIDGGGIKGLYSSIIIKHLEEQYGPISDYFDMICGTSTGGLIAMALSAKKPAATIVDFYINKGPKIFTRDRFYSKVYRALKQTLFWGKYSDIKLKKALVEMLGELTLGQAHTLLCIPSFNLTRGMPRMFKFPHKEGNFHMDKNIKMVDAALATSAAPTYFPIAKIEDGLYIDGGVWCNNPTISGLLEALDYFVGEGKEFSTYRILSISSVNQPTGWKTNVRRWRSFIGWRDKFFQASMDGQSYFTHFFMQKMVNFTNPKGFYMRIPSPQLSAAQCSDIDMDKASSASISLLRHLGDTNGAEYRIKPEVAAFFNSPKIYKTQ